MWRAGADEDVAGGVEVWVVAVDDVVGEVVAAGL